MSIIAEYEAGLISKVEFNNYWVSENMRERHFLEHEFDEPVYEKEEEECQHLDAHIVKV